MTKRSDLIPTVVVDKRGRQTTVYRKPVEGLTSAGNKFPAPATRKSPAKQRKELVEGVVEQFPKRFGGTVRSEMESLSDDSVQIVGECAQKIRERPQVNLDSDLGTFAQMLLEGRVNRFPKGYYQFLLKGIDRVSDEYPLASLTQLYRMNVSGTELAVSEQVLDAHLDAASKYFNMAIKATYDIPYNYTSNYGMFEFIGKHPDKVDLILQHYLTYAPEKNGFVEFEKDLDRLSELSQPIGEGWL